MRRSRSAGAAILAATAFMGVALPAAAQAARRWAVVHENGTFERGRGVTTTARTGPGSYVVAFGERIARCGYVADPGDAATGVVADAAVAAVARRPGHPRALSVQTFNETTHARADEPFHVAVYCRPAARFAVVGRGGVLARGSHARSARRLARGEYAVHFDTDVSGCVFTASVGSTGAEPAAAPGAISVGAGRRPHNVFVTTIGAGGARRDVPFHLVVACGAVPLRAVVRAGGALVRGRDVASTARLATGTYEVIFDRDVSACAYTATVASPAATFSTVPVTVTTASRLGNPDGVFVSVHDTAGAAVDHAFHLVTRC